MSDGKTAEALSADEWYISDGQLTVGPVNFERVTRGIEQGRLSLDVYARRAGEGAWNKLGELPEFRAGESSGVRRTSVPRESGDARADGPSSTAVENARRAVIARELGTIVGAATRGEAALYVLVASVAHLACEGGLVHLVAPDQRSGAKHFVTTCAHGPYAEGALGRRVHAKDPVVTALRGGARSLHGAMFAQTRACSLLRLDALGLTRGDVLVLPLRVRGELLGAIELGAPRLRAAFDARDVELVEQLAAGLALAPR